MHLYGAPMGKLRIDKGTNNNAIKKKDGEERQGMTDTLLIWEEWEEERLGKDKTILQPKIGHIQGKEWGKQTMQIIDSPTEIRQQARITRITADEPDTETWLNQAYAEQDSGAGIRNLANRKLHGNDGIPGGHIKTRGNGQSDQLQELRTKSKMDNHHPETGKSEQ